MLVSQKVGSPQFGVLCATLSIFGGMFLLTLSAKIDHSPESPFWCFEIIVVLFVRRWAAISCNVQDAGRFEVYFFLQYEIVS